MPSSSSNLRIAKLNAGIVRCNRAAAFCSLPSSATATRTCNCPSSIGSPTVVVPALAKPLSLQHRQATFYHSADSEAIQLHFMPAKILFTERLTAEEHPEIQTLSTEQSRLL